MTRRANLGARLTKVPRQRASLVATRPLRSHPGATRGGKCAPFHVGLEGCGQGDEQFIDKPSHIARGCRWRGIAALMPQDLRRPQGVHGWVSSGKLWQSALMVSSATAARSRRRPGGRGRQLNRQAARWNGKLGSKLGRSSLRFNSDTRRTPRSGHSATISLGHPSPARVKGPFLALSTRRGRPVFASKAHLAGLRRRLPSGCLLLDGRLHQTGQPHRPGGS